MADLRDSRFLCPPSFLADPDVDRSMLALASLLLVMPFLHLRSNHALLFLLHPLILLGICPRGNHRDDDITIVSMTYIMSLMNIHYRQTCID